MMSPFASANPFFPQFVEPGYGRQGLGGGLEGGMMTPFGDGGFGAGQMVPFGSCGFGGGGLGVST